MFKLRFMYRFLGIVLFTFTTLICQAQFSDEYKLITKLYLSKNHGFRGTNPENGFIKTLMNEAIAGNINVYKNYFFNSTYKKEEVIQLLKKPQPYNDNLDSVITSSDIDQIQVFYSITDTVQTPYAISLLSTDYDMQEEYTYILVTLNDLKKLFDKTNQKMFYNPLDQADSMSYADAIIRGRFIPYEQKIFVSEGKTITAKNFFDENTAISEEEKMFMKRANKIIKSQRLPFNKNKFTKIIYTSETIDFTDTANFGYMKNVGSIQQAIIKGTEDGKLIPYSELYGILNRKPIEEFKNARKYRSDFSTDSYKYDIANAIEFGDDWTANLSYEEWLKLPINNDSYPDRTLGLKIISKIIIDQTGIRTKEILGVNLIIPATHPSNLRGFDVIIAYYDWKTIKKYFKSAGYYYHNPLDIADSVNMIEALESGNYRAGYVDAEDISRFPLVALEFQKPGKVEDEMLNEITDYNTFTSTDTVGTYKYIFKTFFTNAYLNWSELAYLKVKSKNGFQQKYFIYSEITDEKENLLFYNTDLGLVGTLNEHLLSGKIHAYSPDSMILLTPTEFKTRLIIVSKSEINDNVYSNDTLYNIIDYPRTINNLQIIYHYSFSEKGKKKITPLYINYVLNGQILLTIPVNEIKTISKSDKRISSNKGLMNLLTGKQFYGRLLAVEDIFGNVDQEFPVRYQKYHPSLINK